MLVFGRSLSMRMTGLALVDAKTNRPASRLRLPAHRVVIASPIWVQVVTGGVGGRPIMLSLAVLLVAGTIWAIMRPNRGPVELLTSTAVVRE